MANQEHVGVLRQGSVSWNQWRQAHSAIRPDLGDADLINANLGDADLINANLSDANLGGANLSFAILINANLSDANLGGANLGDAILRGANLGGANLRSAILINTDLRGANLGFADLSFADLSFADLGGADLSYANLGGANLLGANLLGAFIAYTIFGDVDLSEVKGLETLKHGGPSTIGLDTIYKSQGQIPEVFLKEAGVPESFITYMHSLTGSIQPIDYYTCFISYSSKDEEFAKRLYADLQREKVRCWFAPHALRPGTVILHGIDEAIRMYDKLVLILSENAVASNWVEHEVEMALFKEMDKKEQDVLFPIRLDNTVLESPTPWAARLRHRHIADFTCWKTHDDYQAAFTRLLRDLKAEPKKTEEV